MNYWTKTYIALVLRQPAPLKVGDKVHVPLYGKWSGGSYPVLEVTGERCRIQYGPFVSLRRVSAVRVAA